MDANKRDQAADGQAMGNGVTARPTPGRQRAPSATDSEDDFVDRAIAAMVSLQAGIAALDAHTRELIQDRRRLEAQLAALEREQQGRRP